MLHHQAEAFAAYLSSLTKMPDSAEEWDPIIDRAIQILGPVAPADIESVERCMRSLVLLWERLTVRFGNETPPLVRYVVGTYDALEPDDFFTVKADAVHAAQESARLDGRAWSVAMVVCRVEPSKGDA